MGGAGQRNLFTAEADCKLSALVAGKIHENRASVHLNHGHSAAGVAQRKLRKFHGAVGSQAKGGAVFELNFRAAAVSTPQAGALGDRKFTNALSNPRSRAICTLPST
jgi:hypothetical protein